MFLLCISLLKDVVKKAGLWGIKQEIEFPLITRKTVSKNNKKQFRVFIKDYLGPLFEEEGLESELNEAKFLTF